MDNGDLDQGYSFGDLESEDVIALSKAIGPAYLRLSGGI